MNEKNGKQRTKKGDGDAVELVKKFPDRYKEVVYSGKKVQKGKLMQLNGKTGTVIAVDEPEIDHCIVDMDLGKMMSNNTSDMVKNQFTIMDDLTKKFGPLRIYQVNEISGNGTPGKNSTVMELDNISFSLIGDSSPDCLKKLGLLMINAKEIANLTRKKSFKNFVDQFQG